MFAKILIPTDGSKLAVAAAENAVAFARDANASVVFAHVLEPFRIFTTDSDKLTASQEDYDRLSDQQAVQFLAEVELRARHQGVASYTVKLRKEEIHEGIIQAAITNGCDLIALGSHGRGGVAGLILGSVTTKVLSHSRIPVLVYR
ncbi:MULTISPECIES: universal stress protein [unclassified Rhizobium]|uniref:universal stress protein n=1 Tax=unclassified Rhizobium TaxID=2613769 RepID=UPI00160DE480|nr:MULTISPECIES: universal stress protein [unclassified Rhizobium]MBB3545254.1 nucleotide-binding universal stress UspA family protein [Rhizobium sp. BK399]MCS3743231.1 nucleotide-binding universal stress UspA family protein [Rhizobium sp. BK661]MCS4096342.1 nucleotide-binding universal stress UspA family protein [Rhizobium sp. BK176]